MAQGDQGGQARYLGLISPLFGLDSRLAYHLGPLVEVRADDRRSLVGLFSYQSSTSDGRLYDTGRKSGSPARGCHEHRMDPSYKR